MLTDRELLLRYTQDSEKEALGELFHRHYAAVFRVVMRLLRNENDASDVTQATFLKALDHLEGYEDRGQFRAWLLKIAWNEIRDAHRKAVRESPFELLWSDLAETGRNSPRSSIDAEFERELDSALRLLSDHLRAPVVLHYFESLSLSEIGEVLDLPKSTVQSRLLRGLRELRVHFTRQHGSARRPRFDAVFGPAISMLKAGEAAVLPTLGVLALKTKLGITAGLLALILALTIVLRDEPSSPPAPKEAGSSVSAPAGAETESRNKAGEAVTTVPFRESTTELTLEEFGFIGQVLALEDGGPVSGAAILLGFQWNEGVTTVEPGSGISVPPVAVTGADGRFSVPRHALVEDGAVDLVIRKQKFATLVVPALRKEMDRDLGVLLLAAPNEVRGQVTDPLGNPIAGAAVVARGGRPSASVVPGTGQRSRTITERVCTDAEGRFVLEALASGFHQIEVSSPGWKRRILRDHPIRSPVEFGELVIVLSKASATKVRVRDPEGRFIGNALVHVRGFENLSVGDEGASLQSDDRHGKTNEIGEVEFSNDTEGVVLELSLEVSARGFVNTEVRGRFAGEEIDVVLERPSLHGSMTIDAEVIDPENGAIVRVDGIVHVRSGQSGEAVTVEVRNGNFRLLNVAPSELQFRFEVDGFQRDSVAIQVPSDSRPLRVPLGRGISLAGVVQDAHSKVGLEGARLDFAEGIQVFAGRDGRFEVSGLSMTGVRVGSLRVQASGYFDGLPILKLDSGKSQNALVIELVSRSKGSRVSGRVLDVRSHPVAGAEVGIELDQGSLQWRMTRSDSAGRYVFEGIAPSELPALTRMKADRAGFAPLRTTLLASDAKGGFDLVMNAGIRISGQVVDSARTPFPGVTVFAFRDPGRNLDPTEPYTLLSLEAVAGVKSVADGKFEFQNLPNESLLLWALHPDFRVAMPVDLNAHRIGPTSQREGFVITMERGVAISGIATDRQGQAIRGLMVRTSETRHGVLTDHNGRFRTPPIFGPRCSVFVSTNGFRGRVQVSPVAGEAINLPVVRTGSLTGRIVAPDDQSVHADDLFIAEDPEARPTLGGDGSFVFPEVAEGKVTIGLRSKTLPTRSLAIIEVKHGAESKTGDIHLDR